MGRAGHAVFALSAMFLVMVSYGAAANSPIPLLTVELAFFGVGLVLIFLAAIARPSENVWGRIGVGEFAFFMLAVLALKVLYHFAQPVFGWSSFIPNVRQDAVAASHMRDVIVAPIIEEVIFRQFLFRALTVGSSRLAFLVPILGTSAIFALCHPHYWGTSAQLSVALSGVLYGVARARTGGIALPLVMHIAVNTQEIVMWSL